MPVEKLQMRHIRKYLALCLMALFCCYYAGISMFSHTHIANGSSIVHSHLGGGDEHSHSESQYAVIDLLSNFQSECAECFHCTAVSHILISDFCPQYQTPSVQDECVAVPALRGPPQA